MASKRIVPKLALILLSIIPLSTLTILQYENLLFVPATKSYTTINPQTIQFHRELDISNIHNALHTSKAFYELYSEFCNKITLRTNRLNISDTRESLVDSMHRCLKHDDHNFEARTPEDMDRLKESMRHGKVSTVWAGIRLIDGTPCWTSDNAKVVEIPMWLVEKADVTTMFPSNSNITLRSSDKYVFYYHLEVDGQLRTMIRPSTFPDTRTKFYTICTSPEPQHTNTLDLISLTCARDTRQILRTHLALSKELDQLLSPETKHDIHTRQTDMWENFKANFYWAFGIVRIPDFERAKELILNNAKNIDAIAINIETIRNAIHLTQKDIAAIENKIEVIKHDILTIYSDLENKINIFNLQSLIQNTLQKIISAIEAALQGIPSAYVFGQKDLNNVTSAFRYTGIALQNDLKKVTADVIVVNRTYHFFFQVPIDVPDNYVQMYEIKSLPAFNGGQKYMPKSTHKYVGISTLNNEYVLPTDNEFYKCINTQTCSISTPFIKITDNLPCEIQTIKSKSYKCPFVRVDDMEPAYITYNNQTYYSVPNETSIHVKCPQAHLNKWEVINNIGMIETPPDCPLSIQQYSIRPSFVKSKETLESNDLFKILPANDTSFIQYIQETLQTHTERPMLQLRNHTSITKTIQDIFQKDKVNQNMAHFAAFLLGILILFALIFAISKPFRLWFKGCCFITKPSVYWNKVRGYEVPLFVKRQTDRDNTYREVPQPQPEDVVPTSSITFSSDQPTNLLSSFWNMREAINQTRMQVTKDGLGQIYPSFEDILPDPEPKPKLSTFKD